MARLVSGGPFCFWRKAISLDSLHKLYTEESTQERLEDLLEGIRKHVIKISGDNGDQLAQEVLIKVWKGLSRYTKRGPDSFTRWVNTLLRFEGLAAESTVARERARRVFLEDDEDGDEEGLSSSDKLDNLAYATAAASERSKQNAQVALEKIASLGEPFLQTYAALSLEGKNDKDIAAAVGISYGALRQRLFYYRKKLKNDLQKPNKMALSRSL